MKTQGTTGALTEIARKYRIKIIGLPISYKGQKIGVLKVELPTRFDDRRHYDKYDKNFLMQCAIEIGPVLGAIRELLKGEGDYSKTTEVSKVINLTRMAAQLFRTRLVSPDEAKNCWNSLTTFFHANSDQVDKQMKEVLGRLPQEDRNLVKNIPGWISNVVEKSTIEIISKIVTGN